MTTNNKINKKNWHPGYKKVTTDKDPSQPGSTHQIYDLGYEIGITKKKSEKNNKG